MSRNSECYNQDSIVLRMFHGYHIYEFLGESRNTTRGAQSMTQESYIQLVVVLSGLGTLDHLCPLGTSIHTLRYIYSRRYIVLYISCRRNHLVKSVKWMAWLSCGCARTLFTTQVRYFCSLKNPSCGIRAIA